MVLAAEEEAIVETVREFVDKQVRPVVRELEHANTYPEDLIGTMKEIGIFGLSIPEPYGFGAVSMPCYVRVAEELARDRGETPEQVAASTTATAQAFFRLPATP